VQRRTASQSSTNGWLLASLHCSWLLVIDSNSQDAVEAAHMDAGYS
jgi:hypothetical protein